MELRAGERLPRAASKAVLARDERARWASSPIGTTPRRTGLASMAHAESGGTPSIKRLM